MYPVSCAGDKRCRRSGPKPIWTIRGVDPIGPCSKNCQFVPARDRPRQCTAQAQAVLEHGTDEQRRGLCFAKSCRLAVATCARNASLDLGGCSPELFVATLAYRSVSGPSSFWQLRPPNRGPSAAQSRPLAVEFSLQFGLLGISLNRVPSSLLQSGNASHVIEKALTYCSVDDRPGSFSRLSLAIACGPVLVGLPRVTGMP